MISWQANCVQFASETAHLFHVLCSRGIARVHSFYGILLAVFVRLFKILDPWDMSEKRQKQYIHFDKYTDSQNTKPACCKIPILQQLHSPSETLPRLPILRFLIKMQKWALLLQVLYRGFAITTLNASIFLALHHHEIAINTLWHATAIKLVDGYVNKPIVKSLVYWSWVEFRFTWWILWSVWS